jgi:hypothetical protein
VATRQANNEPVTTLPDCSFNGAGERNLSAGRAINLGDGRIYQQGPIYWASDYVEGGEVLVVDCNTLETVVLKGQALVDSSCGPVRYPLAIVDSIADLTEGDSLTELVDFVERNGGIALDAGDYFNETYLADDGGYSVANLPADSVDLLCGCNIFYPDSPGATQ